MITECRLCNSKNLSEILSLGFMEFTGVFLGPQDKRGDGGELNLLLCHECTLVQLDKSFPPEKMYGEGYGYRSSLNQTMVDHLSRHVAYLADRISLNESDIICDIGSNDGSLLNLFTQVHPGNRIGIDPAAAHLSHHYAAGTMISPNFFSASKFTELSSKRARLVTSIAMFYDLESPVAFALDVREVLESGGYWFFEQSYMPWMVETGSYDTICHEHIEYYSLTSIREILKRSGFQLVDAFTTSANGGSIAVLARKSDGQDVAATELDVREAQLGIDSIAGFSSFITKVNRHRIELPALIDTIRAGGQRVAGLGASTKGSVILQWCGLDLDLIDAIGEVNADKFGKLMSGTSIPIVDESVILNGAYDYALILPWHFRSTFVSKNATPSAPRPKLIFPLPDIEIV